MSPVRHRVRRLRTAIVLTAAVTAVGTVAGFVLPRRADDARRTEFSVGLSALESADLAAVSRAIANLEREKSFQPHARLLRGGLLLKQGDPPAALEQLAAVRPLGELRLPFLKLLGESLHETGRSLDAELVFRKLLAENPREADACLRLAAIRHERGDVDGAVREIERAIRIRPDHYLAYRMLAGVYSNNKQDPQAVRAYRKALACDPPVDQRRQIASELAEPLIRMRDYAAGLQSLEQADRNASVLALRAECLLHLGRFDQARESLEEALALDPRAGKALLLQARLRMEQRDPEAALIPLSRLLDLDPHDYEARYQLALAYRRLGRMDESQAEMARMQRSQALRDRLTELYAAASDAPDDPAVRDEIADVCLQLEKPELAASWRRAAEMCRRRLSGNQTVRDAAHAGASALEVPASLSGNPSFRSAPIP